MGLSFGFEAAAIATSLLVIAMYALRRTYPTALGKIFLAVALCNLASSAAGLLAALVVAHPGCVPVPAACLACMASELLHNFTTVLFFMYVVNLVKRGRGTLAQNVSAAVVMLIDAVLILSSPWTGWAFTVDGSGALGQGSLYPVLYLNDFFLVGFALVLFVRNRGKFSGYQTGMVVGYELVVFVVALVAMVAPELTLEDFVVSLMLFLVFASLGNPSDFFYGNTSVFNRLAFEEGAGSRMSLGVPFAVVAISFEDAEYYLRTLDPPMVDAVVRQVGERLKARFGRCQVFYLDRLRFAVLLPGGPEGVAIQAKARRRGKDNPLLNAEAAVLAVDGLLAEDVEVPGAAPLDLRPFYCVAEHPGAAANVAEMEQMLKRGIYLHAAAGSRVIGVADELAVGRKREEEVLRALRRALEDQTLKLYFQPILDVATGRFETAEALVRLIDDELGFVSPDEFIPLAERYGLAPSVSDFVVGEAARFYAEESLESLGVRYLEVNLSTMDLVRDEISETLPALVAARGVEPRRLNLEITETAALESETMLKKNVDGLMECGFAFSIDDYGSGYASINYLIKMPAVLVKIDKTIVDAAMAGDDALAVLSSTVALVHALGKKALAEGVETEEQAALLRSLGVDYFQGYLYSRPLPEPDYLAFLADAPGA